VTVPIDKLDALPRPNELEATARLAGANEAGWTGRRGSPSASASASASARGWGRGRSCTRLRRRSAREFSLEREPSRKPAVLPFPWVIFRAVGGGVRGGSRRGRAWRER
jgi:hypothetical protein